MIPTDTPIIITVDRPIIFENLPFTLFPRIFLSFDTFITVYRIGTAVTPLIIYVLLLLFCNPEDWI